ncbi:MAG: hypothetical protein MAG451_00309 [Anaerolineales bacterium]|nr:hypothetical protein [Anaerolineales bacterium]
MGTNGMQCLQRFACDDAGSEAAEYILLALIIFVLLILMMIPIGNRIEWMWRGLFEILRDLQDMAPEFTPAG